MSRVRLALSLAGLALAGIGALRGDRRFTGLAIGLIAASILIRLWDRRGR